MKLNIDVLVDAHREKEKELEVQLEASMKEVWAYLVSIAPRMAVHKLDGDVTCVLKEYRLDVTECARVPYALLHFVWPDDEDSWSVILAWGIVDEEGNSLCTDEQLYICQRLLKPA